MKIGIDIDGVIIDTINFVSKTLSEYYSCDIKPDELVHGHVKLSGLDGFFEKNGEYLFCTLDPIENSVGVINELGRVHEIFFISARYQIHYDMTIRWLNQHGFIAKRILFTEGKSKIDICRELGIELFIEDSAVNALEIAQNNILVLLYDAEYNRYVEHEGIVRCGSWSDISCFIGDISSY